MSLSSIVVGCCVAAACTSACSAISPPVSPPAASPVRARPVSFAAQSADPAAVPSPVLSFAAERRAILAELISFDTSHGHETDALRPIAKRFEDAGLHAEIFEPAPGRGTLVVRFKGSGAKRPLLLMAHVDVVPVEGQPWTVPPFRATEQGGFLYGRGVSDDKGMASAIVTIVLELARGHATLSRDVIVALTAGEESDKIGVRWLVDHRAELIDAELALDEGGDIVAADDQSHIDAVEVSAAEKIYQSYRLVVHGPGGHSSLPPTDSDPTATLARALERVAAQRFPPRVLPPAKDQLAFRATRAQPPVRGALERIVASAPKVSPGDDKIVSTDRYLNALVHTTCVTTMLQASPQANVLPTTAEAVVNCRILPDETPAQVQATLERIIADRAVTVTLEPELGGGAPLTEIDASVMDAVRKAAARWPGAAVYPTMLVGASDSRFLRAAGIRSYGLYGSPTSFLEATAGRTAHGPDERVPTKWLDDGAQFLRDVVLNLAR
ncbi:MAG TPA: M20/M25/M40 family metallo-hydrolase [Kofleriaceae bacterium]|jgi:acetylornithine deacetylase/succinyl-diaminopimelate desuccinylase-like protein